MLGRTCRASSDETSTSSNTESRGGSDRLERAPSLVYCRLDLLDFGCAQIPEAGCRSSDDGGVAQSSCQRRRCSVVYCAEATAEGSAAEDDLCGGSRSSVGGRERLGLVVDSKVVREPV